MLEIWGPWTVFTHGCVYDQIVVQEYTVCMVLSTTIRFLGPTTDLHFSPSMQSFFIRKTELYVSNA